MPFDAMKGLQEALRDREERHLRVEKHGISEDQELENSEVITRLEKRTRVTVTYYCKFHDVQREGIISEINAAYQYLKLDGEKICFEDIYGIRIIDLPSVREM